MNPPTDLRLRTVLDEAMEERSPATPAALEAMVRPLYPRLVVRARALAHESVVVWYVYREGYWVPASKDEPVTAEPVVAEPVVAERAVAEPVVAEAAVTADATAVDEPGR